MAEIIGRDEELAAVERLLDDVGPRLSVLLLEGEPGIGKSTVWQAGLEEASRRGFVALSCRPAQAEAKLSFASLADLLEPLVDTMLAGLPEPQRHALEVALLRAVPRGTAPDRLAVGTATYSLLRRCAADAPVIVAIDDVQWIDRASSATIAFALRRLLDTTVRVLFASRVGARTQTDPLDIQHLAADHVERRRIGPLTLGAVHHLIRARLGHVFPRPTLRRIAQASGGNPLFALELARVLLQVGALPGPGEPLPVPDTLAALMRARVHRLPAAAQDALVGAALLSVPDVELIVAALGRGAGEALSVAERAEVISMEGGRVRFSHPLIATSVQSLVSAQRRASLHRALAAVTPTPEERARHLALAARGPDETAAAGLDVAAREANARGAPQVAIELADLACRLTPPQSADAQARRTLELARYLVRAGDAERGRRMLETVIAEQPPGPARAQALELLARVLHVVGTAPEAAAHCDQALVEAGDGAELRARIHATRALVSWHDFELARRHARAALDLLQTHPKPDPVVLSQALMAFVESEFYTGRGLPIEAVERGLELEAQAPAPSVSDRMSGALGVWLQIQGDFEGARRWLTTTHETAIAEGDEGSLPYVIGHFVQLELWTGNWPEAERLAREHLELADAMAQPDQRRQALFNIAMVQAHLGREEEARAAATGLLVDAEQADDIWGLANALAALGFLELSLGRPAEAARHLKRNVELRSSIGSSEPFRSFADYAEALIELGQLDEAERLVGRLELNRDRERRPMLAVAARCRGRLLAERQDLDGALASLAEADVHQQRGMVPFDHGRTLLAMGEVLRRTGKRRAAADTLARAGEIFDRLGATLWLARAVADTERIPIRRRAAGELTATEEQVAKLAAAGATNRQVAQALFMAPKTVEANLSRIYRKLGIHSRAELGAKVAERKLEPPASKP